MTIGEMIQKIYDTTYGNTPGKFTNGNLAGYNGRDVVGGGTAISLSEKEGLILVANAISGHGCSIASGTCELSVLVNISIEGYGAYGALAQLIVYQYKNNNSAVLSFSGSYGNSGTFIAIDLYY